MAGDVAAGIRRQQQERTAQVLLLAPACHGGAAFEHGVEVLVLLERHVELRADVAGRDRVRRDVRPEFRRQVLGEPDQPVLGGNVARDRGAADDSQDRGDVDDPAVLACQHVAADLAGHDELRDQVSLYHLAEIRRRGVDDVLAMDDAGIVHQHVDAAMFGDDPADLGHDVRLVGDVERDDLRLAALAGDGARRRLELFHAAAGAEYRGASAREGQCHVAAQPARRAGEQHHAILHRKQFGHVPARSLLCVGGRS